jgi:alpha-mannosidase
MRRLPTLRCFAVAAATLILLRAPAAAQTAADKLAGRLDALASLSYDDWKFNPSLGLDDERAAELSRPDYDDSSWRTMKLNARYTMDNCWLRKVIVLPDRYLGQPLSGPVRILVGVDDYGDLWVNGEKKGHIPWQASLELTPHGRPGDRFIVVIRVVNTGGPLRLLQAALEPVSSREDRQTLLGLALSFRVGQKLLSFDTYQTSARRRFDPGTDKSRMAKAEKAKLNALLQKLAAELDVAALEAGDLAAFKASVAAVRARLKPVAAFAKRFTLYFDANAHIDAAWLWREKETVQVARNTFASVLRMMTLRPDFTYTQSQAVYYDWMERLYPDVFKGIQDRVKDGRWEIVGGMWVEPDCNLPSGESWMRQLLYAKRYFKSKFGTDVALGWNPDSFGYNWNMPQLYAQAGIKAFITQKIGWNETNVFPYRLFWWEGPDGTRILTYFPFDYVDTIEDPLRFADWARQFEANTGLTKMMILFGVGDHGGGPSLEMLARIDRLKSLDVYPAIEHGTAGRYLDWIRAQGTAALPVWKDELYLEYHQGTYTTQARNKAFNRSSEVLLTEAEKFTTLAATLGAAPRNAALEEAWRTVLFNQFHDILPGSGIREVYLDSAEGYRDAQAIGKHELGKALDAIAGQVDTSAVKDGTPLVVFNPLSWERTDLVRAPLPEGEAACRVYGLDGTELPSQVVTTGRYAREILFVAAKVPSLGYMTFVLGTGEPAAPAASGAGSPLAVAKDAIENEFFKVSVDPATGWVRSVVDKRNGREILAGPANRLQLLEDKPAQWDAWNVGLTGVEFPSAFRGAEAVETGPVRAVLRLTRDYLKPGAKKDFPTEDFPSTFLTQDIILYPGLDRVDFRTDVDWWEERTMLKVAFPLAVTADAASFEIPFGSIRRSTGSETSWDKAKVEVPALRWADLSGPDYGASLINNSKYGYDVKGSTIRLSLLRSPDWPDPTADRGRHSIAYSLYPHAGGWAQAATVERGYEFNYPLLPVRTGVHGGSLPAARSFVRIEPANLVLTTVKKAEDSNAWVLQWYDATGVESEAVLTLPRAPSRAVLSDIMEADGPPLAVQGTTVRFRTRKNALAVIKVYF